MGGQLTMKKTLQVLLLFITVFSLIGCKNEEKLLRQEIEALVKDYKSTLYSIDDPLNPPKSLEVAQSANHI